MIILHDPKSSQKLSRGELAVALNHHPRAAMNLHKTISIHIIRGGQDGLQSHVMYPPAEMVPSGMAMAGQPGEDRGMAV